MEPTIDLRSDPSSEDAKPKALVVGAGVIGLTSALRLRRQGFRVDVVADQFAPAVTSVVAGALWEWPPAVCGYHHDVISLARSKQWCMTSYEIFRDLAHDPSTGVHWRDSVFYFRHRVEDRPADLRKMDELRGKVADFRHDPGLIAEGGVNPDLGLVDAYSHKAPMVDTDRYMAWLLDQVRRAGCAIARRRITGNLAARADELCREHGADVIVNCTGLGAMALTDDPMYPLRGALVRIHNDGIGPAKLDRAHCVSHDESQSGQDIVFIVPRGDDRVVLGGLAEPDEWSTDLTIDGYQPVADMFERCLEFLPSLRNAALDDVEPLRVGLRPFRASNVRVEVDAEAPIIHNYGHGGAGVTLSWGCASEAAAMASELVGRRDAPDRSDAAVTATDR